PLRAVLDAHRTPRLPLRPWRCSYFDAAGKANRGAGAAPHAPRAPASRRTPRAPRLHPDRGMAKRNRARAVFHDRVAMEEAVRALELEGVSARRIHVSRADASGGHVRTPAEGGRAAGVGAGFGAVVGGALALLAIAAAD